MFTINENVNCDFDNNQNVLFTLFGQNDKTNLLDMLYIGFASLNLSSAYYNLCKQLEELFGDQTNGKKYFNNLVNILEILDWVQNQYPGFNNELNYFRTLWNKFKSNDQIDDFINLVKNFDDTDSEYMFVVRDANGNTFKTPGLQLTTAQILFDNNEIIVASDINNTCKTGSTVKKKFKELSLNPYDVNVNHRLNKRTRNDLTTEQKLNCDIFGKDSNAIEYLRALKKIKDQYEWTTKIYDTYGLTLQDFKELIGKIPSYCTYNIARLLSKPEDDKILFYNVPIRGKGNGDFIGVDSEKYELFSIFNKGYILKLKLYHLSYNDSRVQCGDKHGSNFLFDKVSYNSGNKNLEGYEAEDSGLTR